MKAILTEKLTRLLYNIESELQKIVLEDDFQIGYYTINSSSEKVTFFSKNDLGLGYLQNTQFENIYHSVNGGISILYNEGSLLQKLTPKKTKSFFKKLKNYNLQKFTGPDFFDKSKRDKLESACQDGNVVLSVFRQQEPYSHWLLKREMESINNITKDDLSVSLICFLQKITNLIDGEELSNSYQKFYELSIEMAGTGAFSLIEENLSADLKNKRKLFFERFYTLY